MVSSSLGLIGKDEGKLVWSVAVGKNEDIHIWREGELQTYCGLKLNYTTAMFSPPTCDKCKKKAEENGLA